MVPDRWLEAVVDGDGVIERVSCELCVLVALKNALRRREIYVNGAARWRNPEEDLPADFEDNRDVHYENLRQPLDEQEFIATLKEAMRTSMADCAAAITKKRSGGTKVTTHRGEPRWVDADDPAPVPGTHGERPHDRLGADRPAIRPDGQLRHHPQAAHRRDRAGAAPLHPRVRRWARP
ncbi:hypothetical protein OHA77_23715 [Streptosporangium sp. NBC_01639]|nr:hypothetical protein OHA77_23715 [Streptosporangium sp. NBC_01639]